MPVVAGIARLSNVSKRKLGQDELNAAVFARGGGVTVVEKNIGRDTKKSADQHDLTHELQELEVEHHADSVVLKLTLSLPLAAGMSPSGGATERMFDSFFVASLLVLNNSSGVCVVLSI